MLQVSPSDREALDMAPQNLPDIQSEIFIFKTKNDKENKF